MERTCTVADIVARSYENRQKLMDIGIYSNKGGMEIYSSILAGDYLLSASFAIYKTATAPQKI